MLSLISAFVPHYEAGYRLMAGVLIAGMLPYMVYGLAVPLSLGIANKILGLLIIIVHALIVINHRIIGNADYDNGMIYYGPIILALIVLPLVLISVKKALKR